jgi:hypothetical protein
VIDVRDDAEVSDVFGHGWPNAVAPQRTPGLAAK